MITKEAISQSGSVFAVTKSDGSRVAHKYYSDSKFFNVEFALLSSFSHQNIIKCVKAFKDNNQFVLELPLLIQPMIRDMSSKLQLLSDVTCALYFIHSLSLMHHDVKLQNVLFDGHNYLLIDFENCEKAPSSSNCGTPLIRAPEVRRGEPHGTECDIFSLGVLALQLFEMDQSKLQMLFKPEETGLKQSEINDYLDKFVLELQISDAGIKKEVLHFLKYCLAVDPKARATAEDLVFKVDFIYKFPWDREGQ